MYQISYSSHAANFLRQAQPKLQKQIKNKLEKFSQDPFAPNPNLDKMTELYHGYRLRIGNYRLIYELDTKTHSLIVWKINHRSSVYKP